MLPTCRFPVLSNARQLFAIRSAQAASYATSTNPELHPIKNVAVYGSGLMGAGIAQVAATNNFKVTLVDIKPEFLKKAHKNIENSLSRIAKKAHPDDPQSFIDNAMSNITTSTSAPTAAASADLIIEAIVESLEIKRKLFKVLDEAAPTHTIFTSNTSSLSIGDIAKGTKREDRFAGLHFFNPVPMMKLVEVVRTNETRLDVFKALIEFAKKLGKVPVDCKDTPGFIVNRLLVPYMMEAVRIVERGEATPQDVDTAMKLGAGYPMGPFELADYVGLDTIKFIVDGWYKSGRGLAGNDLVKPSRIIDDLIKKGYFGRKSGKGFYDYADAAKVQKK